MVVTNRLGTAMEPRNFHRQFKARCRKAEVPVISVPVIVSVSPKATGAARAARGTVNLNRFVVSLPWVRPLTVGP